MRLLISAFACRPHVGSEPGIGWHWSVEAAKRGWDVCVVTRGIHRRAIEVGLRDVSNPMNLSFVYYELPNWLRRLCPAKLSYVAWQYGAFRYARALHAERRFDAVHHLVIGSVRGPTFMPALGIPFFFGPVAGGETAPWRLRRSYGIRGWCIDAVRDLAGSTVRLNPVAWWTFRRAARIAVTSSQTLSLLPKCFHRKTNVQLAIGIDASDIKANVRLPDLSDEIRILFAGRILFWKGMHLGLRAFAKFCELHPRAVLTLVGNGPERKRWLALAGRLGVAEKVEFVGRLDQHALFALYRRCHVFLFPSFHDSGGVAVLEALAHGLPIVCLDVGGPGIIVDETCGVRVATHRETSATVIQDLSKSLAYIVDDGSRYVSMSRSARRRAEQFTWRRAVEELYSSEFPARERSVFSLSDTRCTVRRNEFTAS